MIDDLTDDELVRELLVRGDFDEPAVVVHWSLTAKLALANDHIATITITDDRMDYVTQAGLAACAVHEAGHRLHEVYGEHGDEGDDEDSDDS